MKIFKKLNLLVASIMGISAFAFSAAPAHAALFEQAKQDACKGATLGSTSDCTDKADNKLTSTISDIINVFSVIIGIVAVVMIMISGFRYITSAGDANGITAAKNTLIYAIVGLVVVAFAQIIVRFVLSKT